MSQMGTASSPSFFNTLSRRVEPFCPMDEGKVRMYACGPTVYDYAHIGNFRYFVWVDLVRRYLAWRGFDVVLVVNITDVDDNTIEGARKARLPLNEFTQRYSEAFFEDVDVLGIQQADYYPRATEHIPEMVKLVDRLLERGYAYEQDGSIYFRVASFDDYGMLALLDPRSLKTADRIEKDAYKKEDTRDFVLWKARKEGEPAWETDLGPGRPGWHLECSAMSMKYLGESFDLHLGGVDLVFPHHQNELAQSEAATGNRFVTTWMHCAHLVVDGIKMSKSLGNFHTLRDLLKEGHRPSAIRYLLASVHYRRPLNLTREALKQAQASVTRLRDVLLRIEEESVTAVDQIRDGRLEAALVAARAGFMGSMDEDMNTAGALGHMFTLVREVNSALDEGRADSDTLVEVADWLRDVDHVWGILHAPVTLDEIVVEVGENTVRASGPPLTEGLATKLIDRIQARAKQDFMTADRLRDELLADGVRLEDTPLGVRWHRDKKIS